MASQNNVFYSTIDKMLQSGTPILVTDPRRVGEGREAHIEYLIQIEGHSVRRRFSEFDSFRENLVKINPTCIVPPLPEKDGLTISAVSFNLIQTNTTNADHESIEKRRAHLQSFLNRIAKHPILSACRLFHRFLEADTWSAALAAEDVKGNDTLNILNALSAMTARVQRPDSRFLDVQNHTQKFGQQVGALERNVRRLVRRQTELGGDYAELGAIFQAFSTNEKELSQALSKTGEAIDGAFLSSRYMVSELDTGVLEPLQEYIGYVGAINTVLKTHDRQYSAVESMLDQLQAKRDQLKTTELQIAGQPTFEPVTAGNLFRKIGSVFDSNPQQTLRDNAVKLQGTIEALEKETDEANSAVTKSSEAILNDFNLYEQSKAADFKAILTHYAKSELDYHQKNAALWENVIPVVEKTAIR